MSIGDRISQLRKEQNISQVQLSRALGVSRQAISKWENDQTAPDTIKLIQLADLLGTDSEYLATGKHATVSAPPTVVTKIEKVDHYIEKPIEKVVEVERIVERTVEVPYIQKVIRKQYVRNPLEFAAVGLAGLLIGLIIGLLV